MMSFIIAVLLLGFLVFVHEFGHFIIAKISGMNVETFSIGMGPAISTFKKGGTEYIIAAIPAGGYVSVTGATGELDEEDALAPDDPRRYPNRPLLHRAFFAAAGPLMNLLVAVLIFILVFMSVGVEVPKMETDTIISTVTDKSPAQAAGLQAGDRVLAVDGQAVNSWAALQKAIGDQKGAALNLQIDRKGQVQAVTLMPKWDKGEERYLIGIAHKTEYEQRQLSLPEAATASVKMTKQMSMLIFDAVGNLVTGKASVSDKEEGLAGPVGIVKAIDESTQHGLVNVLMLTAALSVNLGLLNLLPIPALDGSRLLFLLLEAVRGRPVSAEKEGLVNLVGFAFLMGLMIYVTFNDISRLV